MIFFSTIINYNKSICLILLCLLISCIPPSTEKVEQTPSPNNNHSKTFETENYGTIQYQLYKKYGFTDIEEQLIEIHKPKGKIKLKNRLPIDSTIMTTLELIDTRKFRPSFKINYLPEKTINSDILIKSEEYSVKRTPVLSYEKGQYEIVKTENKESIIIYDELNQLIYVEIKK
jgi:hypothetical protein